MNLKFCSIELLFLDPDFLRDSSKFCALNSGHLDILEISSMNCEFDRSSVHVTHSFSSSLVKMTHWQLLQANGLLVESWSEYTGYPRVYPNWHFTPQELWVQIGNMGILVVIHNISTSGMGVPD